MTQHNERIAPDAGAALARVLVPEIALPLVVCAGLLAWIFARPLPGNPTSPPGALWVLVAVMLVTALLMRRLRVHFGLDARASLALPDPLYTLDLATAILVGPRPAVVLALVASLLVTLPDGHAGQPEWITVLRQAAAAGAATLIAASAYRWLSLLLAHSMPSIHAHLIAAIVASVIMLGGASALRALDDGPGALLRPFSWQAALTNPAIRFQALMLSIGPLLPLADVLDDVDAELAWILFLVPLYALYYLALISIRLEQRKAELQRTVEELRLARRREAELTGYAALVTRAQEEERRRLARELHDDTAQTLVALARGLDTLSSRTSGQAPAEQDTRFVEDLSGLAKRSLESIRRACHDLRPSVLDDLGLSAALESLASATTQRGLPCEFTQRSEPGEPEHGMPRQYDIPPYPPEVETTIYRIAQEALSNAQRHARAHQAEIELTYLPAALRLIVRDDGHGFAYAATASDARHTATAPGSPAGLGLLGMRERAALIGAQLEIASAPGQGAHVELLVRLDDAAAM